MAVEILRPNARGDKQNIYNGNPASRIDNWSNVDDIVPDENTSWAHIGSEQGGWFSGWQWRADLYNIDNHSVGSGVINKITVYGRIRRGTNGVHFWAGIRLHIKTGGSEFTGSTQYHDSTNYAYKSEEWATNPDTGNPWTWDEIDALQIGMFITGDKRSNYERDTYCTQIYVEVDYTPVVEPTVTTDPATSVESEQAILNGTLDADGEEACDCGFEYGETIAYGNTTPTQSRTTGQTFAQTITGLDPKKTYHFRAFATNAAGTGYGANRTFTTLATAPTVVANPATDIEHIAAALNGELTYDGGEACDCGFEWGLTMAYGNTTPTQSRTTGQTFSQPISGLAPNTPYHFRAFTTNSWGTSYSPDRSFTTLASAPLTTTDPATGLGAALATINGTLDNDIGEACQCGFEWGLDTGYGTITSTESKTTGETFSQVIGGLAPNTTYHFRAFATNSFGTGYGADRSFTTALVISKAYALAREEL